jgi:hypothetical protein
MFVREPIVLCLSLLSSFSNALIFTPPRGGLARLQTMGFRHSSLGIGIHHFSHRLLHRLILIHAFLHLG